MFGFVNAKQMIRCELSADQMRSSIDSAMQIWETRKRWGKNGTQGNWQQGQFSKPWLSFAVGLRGEIAFWEIMRTWIQNLPRYDLRAKNKIAKSDFVFDSPFGTRHEIKTSVNRDLFSTNYIRTDHLERNDVFWFACVRDLESPNFVLRGWATRDEITKRGVKKFNKKGGWENFAIETDMLNPISKFLRKGDG